MPSQIFKFTIARPVHAVTRKELTANQFLLSEEEEGLIAALRRAKKRNAKADILKLSLAFINSEKFVDTPKKIDPRFIDFIAIINGSNRHTAAYIKEHFERIFTTPASAFISTPLYLQTFNAVSESIMAATIEPKVSSKARSLLVHLSKALQLIQHIAKGLPIHQEQLSQIRIVLPDDIFPLPSVDTHLKAHRKNAAAKKKKALEEKTKKILQLNEELVRYKNAINEVLDIFDMSTPEADNATSSSAKDGFLMAKKDIQKLSPTAKATIKSTGLGTEEIDVSKTVYTLEKQSAQAAQTLFAYAGTNGNVVRFGNGSFLPFNEEDLQFFEPGTNVSKTPGLCPPAVLSGSTTDGTTPVVATVTDGIKVGFADLLMVEQQLERYELGEIAHIENVLKSELRDRKHRASMMTEASITTETEATDSKEKDLSSAERFELQTETQKNINESTSMDAGITVSASYGFVDTTANFNYANSNALTESQRAASNFARETISKAISKLETRNLERRFSRSVQETEEINQHSFDNKAGTENISGVYRFVDKIYSAQIVNYGKRMMLEFIVPEPAAFLRFAMTKQPVDTTLIKPAEPGYCSSNGRSFTPLQVQDIDRNNYLFWASKYGAENVSPAPSNYKIIGKAFSKEGRDLLKDISNAEDFLFWHAENAVIDIDNGYIPLTVKVRVDFAVIDKKDGPGEDDNQRITIQVGSKKQTYRAKDTYETSDDFNAWTHTIDSRETNSLPVTISSFGVRAFGITLTTLCRLSPNQYEKWQLDTYIAIMNAYNDQKSRYDNAIEAAKIREGFTGIIGSNPLANRAKEQVELKKGCISLLTAQHFDAFDAMNRNVGANGYPEIDFDEAADEAKFISFFEQAFEWNNMTYIFYPYFWANKSQWPMLAQLNDDDALFTKFLQAGSCRVVVPVRPAFEIPVTNYLYTGLPWSSEVVLVNNEDGVTNSMHLSIIEELSSQMNKMNSAGMGKLNLTKDSAIVTGVGTFFIAAAENEQYNDENKRIIIAGKTYIIKQVDSPTQIQLKTAYSGETENNLTYSFGAKLVDEAWEVRLPTNLIKIDDTAGNLIL